MDGRSDQISDGKRPRSLDGVGHGRVPGGYKKAKGGKATRVANGLIAARLKAAELGAGQGVSLMDAGPDAYLFIAGDARTMMVYGEPVVPNRPYCPDHLCRCWNRVA